MTGTAPRPEQLLSELLEQPPRLSVPPRVYVSAAEEDAAARKWTASLCDELRRRGREVVVAGEEDTATSLTGKVLQRAARLATCQVYLMVIDSALLEHLQGASDSRTPEWWDHQLALRLTARGRLQPIGLLREGTDLPPGARLIEPGRPGNTFDVRTEAARKRALDEFFPPLEAVLSDQQRRRAEALLQESHDKEASGDAPGARHAADQLAQEFPELVDGHRRRAELALTEGRAEDLLEAARRAAAIEPEQLEHHVLAAQGALHARRFSDVVAALAPALEAQTVDWRVHALLGDALDELGQVWAGIAHLELARRANPKRADLCVDTGMAWRHVGRTEEATRCFEAARALAPEDPDILVNLAATHLEAGHSGASQEAIDELEKKDPDHSSLAELKKIRTDWLAQGGQPPVLSQRLHPRTAESRATCDSCPADIPIAGKTHALCNQCGAERMEIDKPCPLCKQKAVVPIGLRATDEDTHACPYCREGTLRVGRV